jgi:hypothetical protein
MRSQRDMAGLVIGGTGMLAEATRWMARHYRPTLLVARRASRFAADEQALVALDLDWHRPDFVECIAKAVERLPRIGKSLIWLHEPERLLGRLMPLISPEGAVIVLGSMDGQPAVPAEAEGAATIRLGSMPSGRGRRWLTHQEISRAAIAALRDGKSRIVGDLVPIG